jgi:DNA-binding transcriptional regulator YiaG
MIHAYDEFYLPIIQNKLGIIFEIATLKQKENLGDFGKSFLSSNICKRIEEADPVYVLGKSASELYALIKNIEPFNLELSDSLTPEFWTGYVLAYAQWYFNTSFENILANYSLNELIKNYFPYHEMDILKTMELFKNNLRKESKLSKIRRRQGLSQNDLSILSGVSSRLIRAYEQKTLDISKAQFQTVYALSKALCCEMEDLV